MKNNKSANKYTAHLDVKILSVFFMFAVLLSCVCSAIGYAHFTRSIENRYNNSAYMTAKTALTYVNADRIARYLETGVTDAEYDRTLELLNKLTVSEEVSFIYIAKLDPSDWQTGTYIYDTVNPSLEFANYELGYTDKVIADQYVADVKEMMTTGISNDTYFFVAESVSGPHTTAALPVKDSYGNVVAFLGVEREMSDLVSTRSNYMRNLVIANISTAILFLLFGFLYMRKSIITPLRLLKQETAAFSAGNATASEKLKTIRSTDEIGQLAASVYQMEYNLVDYYRQQAEVQRLKEQEEIQARASQSKAEFYSRMSHDMRTPMNGILGVAELSKGETDVAVLQANIKKIQESGEYLLNLVNDTLDIQRIESGRMMLEPKIVNTTDVVNNILDMVRVTAKAKGVNLKFDSGNADLKWYVRADVLRLKQIFINLLSNAIKFTPVGGTVEWKFRLLSREGMISHDVIYVRDTGVGMSKAFLENGIFKPFSQETNAVSTQYAGSGLGLSIAKSLVELMGGRIEVESELGVGTIFAVYLDFERVDTAEVQAALKNEKKQSKDVTKKLMGKKILLAEDHPLNAEIAKKLLQKAGCEVTWVANGQEAVKCFAKAPVHLFNAILMDIRMPVMDGLEAAREIRALGKKDAVTIPIIAMTANAYEEDVKASLDAGMNAHLGKPIDSKDLYETLATNI